jgi:hypothetical protein
MSRKKRKTKIIIETDSRLILNRHSGDVAGGFDDCDHLAVTVRPGEPVALAAFRLGSVCRAVAGQHLQGIKPNALEDELDPWPKLP